MSRYINLNRIEFGITNACTGRCKHCALGRLSSKGGSVDAMAAVTAVKQLAKKFEIQSVMTFGGEPLLFADTVCKIHAAARECKIPKRQLITNGFFTENAEQINRVAKAVVDCGINDVMLSVDAFHQETIPLEPVLQFANALTQYGIPSLRAHPAWVVNKENDNLYNRETKRLLKIFTSNGIEENYGNDISPSGNALIHLAEYFPPPGEVDLTVPCGSAKYTSRPNEVDCLNIRPNGEVCACTVIGNIYNNDILKIVNDYDPYKNPALCAVLDGGVPQLLRYAKAQGVEVDYGNCRSACGVCRMVMGAVAG
jgi:MoaA/NifB/PqqE/SkfB family radical SAM enzyme